MTINAKSYVNCSLVIILLCGCAARVPIRRLDWHYETGVGTLLTTAATDFDTLQDLRAEARISYEQAGQRDKGTAGLLYRHPGMLRVEVHGGPFSSNIMTALLDGDSLTVISGDGYWKEPAGGSALVQLVDIDMGHYPLDYVLFGMVEPMGSDSLATLEYPRADLLIATVEGPGRRRRLWIDRHGGFVTREEIDLPGKPTLVRELKDYRLVAGVYMPQQIEIRQAGAALILAYRRYQPNTGLTEGNLTRGIP